MRITIAILSVGVFLALTGCSKDPGGAGGSADAEWSPSVSSPGETVAENPAEPVAPAPASAKTTPEPAPLQAAPEPAGGLHPSELTDLVDMPRVETGKPPQPTLLDQLGYELPPDPEAESVHRGRRLVKSIKTELSGAYDTPEELAQVVLDAIFFDDAGLLHEQRVTREEFDEIFWPEFPQSRPATNIKPHDAWMFHNAECLDGVKEMLFRWGGMELSLRNIRYEEGLAQYANFNLYHGVVLEAVTDRGEVVEIPYVPMLAERNGRWKVYMFAS